ncbi:MAG: hypothetical protein II244_07710 [Clostridia bacterium]|nr:hypothetical protein [Clostridia bacterium]
MYVFTKENKNWTCPDSSLVTIAHIQATDRDDAIKEGIVNNEIAKAYLEKLGFEISHVEDPEPLTEVPKVADWYNRQHRELYNKLFYYGIDRPLTKEEDEFCKTMYHMEEFACGLDGDR